MAPHQGSIHRRSRGDSTVPALLTWARGRRSSWTVSRVAKDLGLSERRARAIVRALGDAGLLEQVSERASTESGWVPAEWRILPAGRMATAPVLIAPGGRIVGVRTHQVDHEGFARLRNYIDTCGLARAAIARQLRVTDSTLRDLLAGRAELMRGDPILDRLARIDDRR